MARKKGLDLLFGGGAERIETPAPVHEMTDTSKTASVVQSLDINLVSPNPDQPRKRFDDDELNELASSIRSKGVLSPILVRQRDERFEIIAGERRWRASLLAGLNSIPALIIAAGDLETVEISLIENIQRNDLTPVETAYGYATLADQFKMTHDDIAQRVGVSRASVSNLLRILGLPAAALSAIDNGDISLGHAKILVGLPDEETILDLAQRIIVEKMSVRELETIVASLGKKKKSKAHKLQPPQLKPGYLRELEERLTGHFGTKVLIIEGKKKGQIIVEFYSNDDFDHILERIGLNV